MHSMIRYQNTTTGITPTMLNGGFFVGWPNPPDAEGHLRMLDAAYRVWLAVDDDTGQVVGFINAISDGVLSAYIPLLEVLPAYQGKGIGLALAQRMLQSLQHLYMVDLLCDGQLQAFYARAGMRPAQGMMTRNYELQSGNFD
ncbi:MAG: GNAT family N-acetyltransferase [Chloroflexota bacterium]